MSRFTAIDAADKEALKARAISLKPRALNVVATSLGWAQSRPNGQLELLVSFRDLDDLLGDLSSDQVATAEPVSVTPEAAPVEPVAEVPAQEAAPVAADDATAPKKAGRPKKADATTTDATTPATDTPAVPEQAAAPVATETKAAQ